MKNALTKALTIQSVATCGRLTLNRLAQGLEQLITEHLPHKNRFVNGVKPVLFKPIKEKTNGHQSYHNFINDSSGYTLAINLRMRKKI